MRALLATAVAVAVAGCAASGVKVSEAQINALQKGVTTADEVVHRFGSPTSRLRTSDGATTLVYSYAESSVRAATFVPVVNLFAGGADVRAQSVVLRFGPDGKLIDYTSSSTQTGTGTGIAAGNVDTSRAPGPQQ